MKNNLSVYRKQIHYSQKNISLLLGINIRTYQAYEYGEIDPPVKVLLALSNIYQISIDELIGNPITSIQVQKLEKIKEIITPEPILKHIRK